MSSRRDYVIGIIAQIVQGTKAERVQTAEQIVDRLSEEGVLHLGYGNADVDMVLQSFAEGFGATKITQADRWAATRLVRVHTTQAVVGVIKLLSSKRAENYVPTVNNVAQLETKWPSVIAFLRKQAQESEIIEV